MQGLMKVAVMNGIGEMGYETRDIPRVRDHEVLVRVEYVGICGSDLHYYETGRIGNYIVEPPFVLGHESAGTVVEVGSAVTHLAAGDRVSLEPGIACGHCEFCKSGRYNLCPDVVFFATPPVDGVFCEYVAHPADLCFKLPDNVDTLEGALIEPDGRLSTDPHTLYGPYDAVGPRDPSKGQGAIRAFGEHKGSGLSFMCEMLAGCLTAGGTSGPIKERTRIANGMLSIFLSPKHFGTQAEFEAMGLRYAEWISETRPANPAEPVLRPGEPEAQRRADRTASGVPLPAETWSNILATATRLGVKSPI